MKQDSTASIEGHPRQGSNMKLRQVSRCLFLVRLKVILSHKYLAFPKLLDPREFHSLGRVSRVWVQLPSDQLSIY